MGETLFPLPPQMGPRTDRRPSYNPFRTGSDDSDFSFAGSVAGMCDFSALSPFIGKGYIPTQAAGGGRWEEIAIASTGNGPWRTATFVFCVITSGFTAYSDDKLARRYGARFLIERDPQRSGDNRFVALTGPCLSIWEPPETVLSGSVLDAKEIEADLPIENDPPATSDAKALPASIWNAYRVATIDDEFVSDAESAVHQASEYAGQRLAGLRPRVSISDDGTVTLQWRGQDEGALLVFTGDDTVGYSLERFHPDSPYPACLR